MKNPYKKSGEGLSGDQKNSGKQKTLQCGHDANNRQVLCYNCSQIGRTAKKCKSIQNDYVHNNVQGESSLRENEFGMNESCENLLDDDMYSEYYKCNLVELSDETGYSNALCTFLSMS